MTCTGFAFIFVMLTCDAPPQSTVVVCPPVRTWTPAFQKQVAAEMRAAPGSALASVAVQSIGDRDIVRACVAQNQKRAK